MPPILTAFAEMAKKLGVQRLVLLSGRGEEGAQRCEDIVLAIDPRWTVVRASWFNQNFSEGPFQPGIQHGALALPAGGVREPFVDVDDIADVAVAALTSDGHEGQIYEVTGPRLLTFAEAVAEIAAATGRRIDYRQIATQDYVGAATAQGAPKEIADLLTFLFDTVLDGRNEHVADGVQRALGRPPRDFRDYAQDVAATGVWDQPRSPEGVVRRLIDEAFNRGRTEVLPELVHADYVYRSPGERVDGAAGLQALITGYRTAFPDLHVHIDELVATDDTTVTSITLTGTHRGALLGIAPTGKTVAVHGMVRSRFRDGRIADEWEVLDMHSLFEQLGVVEVAS
ncbi:MAG: ester cyclase [Planctomycetota bacterium]